MAVGGLAAAALFGCGDKKEATPSRTLGPQPTVGAVGTVVAANARKRGGTLKFGYHTDPGFLSPRLSRSGFDNAFMLAYGDNYVYTDAKGAVKLDWSLFDQMEYKDASTLNVRLRSGVKFHDGSPLDSAAAAAHIDYVRDPKKATKFGYTALLASLDKIETPDAQRMVFKLKTPDVGFLSAFAVQPGMPFSIKQVEKLGDDEILKPIMTGPYKTDVFQSAAGWTVVKNDAYWGPKEGAPFLDKMEFKIITQSETRGAAMEAGDLDATWFSGADATTLRLSKNTNLQARSFEVGPSLLSINQSRPPTNNLKVRQAVASAIDKARLLQIEYQGQGQVAKSMLPSDTFGYDAYDPYPYNVEKAKQFLKDSGVASPAITLAYGGDSANATTQLIVAAYKEMLDAAGFKTVVENVPGPSGIQEAMFTKESHNLGLFSTGVRPDPVAQFSLYLSKDANFNAGVKTSTDPAQLQLNELIAKAKVELDDRKREEILKQISKVHLDNVIAQIPVVARIRWAFAKKNVQGFNHPEYLNTPAGAGFRPFLLSLG